jgi:hypothetical protein
MAITYKLNDQRVCFHWDKETDLWTVESEDLDNLRLEAKSFNGILQMLTQQHPELVSSIRIFFQTLLKKLLRY